MNYIIFQIKQTYHHVHIITVRSKTDQSLRIPRVCKYYTHAQVVGQTNEVAQTSFIDRCVDRYIISYKPAIYIQHMIGMFMLSV